MKQARHVPGLCYFKNFANGRVDALVAISRAPCGEERCEVCGVNHAASVDVAGP